MSQKHRYDNVSQMVRNHAEKEFADSFEKLLSQRQLMKQLLVMRVAKGLSQEDMATEMECTQGRISKLENHEDGELSLHDLYAYLDVLGYRPQLLFVPKDFGITDQVKYHWGRTKELTQELVGLAGADEKISVGVARFFGEVCCNFLGMLLDNAKTLPAAALKEVPFFKIIGLSPEKEDEQADPPKLISCAQPKHQNGSATHV